MAHPLHAVEYFGYTTCPLVDVSVSTQRSCAAHPHALRHISYFEHNVKSCDSAVRS